MSDEFTAQYERLRDIAEYPASLDALRAEVARLTAELARYERVAVPGETEPPQAPNRTE